MQLDGAAGRRRRYAIAGTPCEGVLGEGFRAYPPNARRAVPRRRHACATHADRRLRRLSAAPTSTARRSASSRSRRARRCGASSASSRCCRSSRCAPRPRSSGCAPTRRCAARRRATATIFEAIEDGVFIHDWDTGALVDVNPKACDDVGLPPRGGARRAGRRSFCSGDAPYTRGRRAPPPRSSPSDGRCPPFEWRAPQATTAACTGTRCG